MICPLHRTETTKLVWRWMQGPQNCPSVSLGSDAIQASLPEDVDDCVVLVDGISMAVEHSRSLFIRWDCTIQLSLIGTASLRVGEENDRRSTFKN